MMCELRGEDVMVAFGERLGSACADLKAVIFLAGDLGLGKTTLSRGVLRAFGHQGAVKSPTYTLVEPYEFAAANVYHFDLYRLGSPEELEYMGIRDYFEGGNTVCLVEWADRGLRFLPEPDVEVIIKMMSGGRQVSVIAYTDVGETIVERLRS